jgi:hypothetical protein
VGKVRAFEIRGETVILPGGCDGKRYESLAVNASHAHPVSRKGNSVYLVVGLNCPRYFPSLNPWTKAGQVNLEHC